MHPQRKAFIFKVAYNLITPLCKYSYKTPGKHYIHIILITFDLGHKPWGFLIKSLVKKMFHKYFNTKAYRVCCLVLYPLFYFLNKPVLVFSKHFVKPDYTPSGDACFNYIIKAGIFYKCKLYTQNHFRVTKYLDALQMPLHHLKTSCHCNLRGR